MTRPGHLAVEGTEREASGPFHSQPLAASPTSGLALENGLCLCACKLPEDGGSHCIIFSSICKANIQCMWCVVYCHLCNSDVLLIHEATS